VSGTPAEFEPAVEEAATAKEKEEPEPATGCWPEMRSQHSRATSGGGDALGRRKRKLRGKGGEW